MLRKKRRKYLGYPQVTEFRTCQSGQILQSCRVSQSVWISDTYQLTQKISYYSASMELIDYNVHAKLPIQWRQMVTSLIRFLLLLTMIR